MKTTILYETRQPEWPDIERFINRRVNGFRVEIWSAEKEGLNYWYVLYAGKEGRNLWDVMFDIPVIYAEGKYRTPPLAKAIKKTCDPMGISIPVGKHMSEVWDFWSAAAERIQHEWDAHLTRMRIKPIVDYLPQRERQLIDELRMEHMVEISHAEQHPYRLLHLVGLCEMDDDQLRGVCTFMANEATFQAYDILHEDNQ